MAARAQSVLSQTLQSISITKIKELEKQRSAYENRKGQLLAQASSIPDRHDRLVSLLKAVKELCPGASHDGSLSNMERWIDQSRYDQSIPDSTLETFEEQLRKKLDIQSRKLDMARLYSCIITEWMESSSPSSAEDANSASAPGEDFEVVEERQKQRLSELVDKFESVVFEPLETSEANIAQFLNNFFTGDDDKKTALRQLRDHIGLESRRFSKEKEPFTEHSLTTCLRGLLCQDLLSDEKQALLRDFLQSKAALGEIADVLNMRFSDLRNWAWGGDIPVMPRQQLNGKYRIWADEDILDMIFAQFIGVRLCIILKVALRNFVEQKGIWDWQQSARPTSAERERARYYLQDAKSVEPQLTAAEAERRKNAAKNFLNQLPDNEDDMWDRLPGAYEPELEEMAERRKQPSNIKQELLRTLTTELIIGRTRGVTAGSKASANPGSAIVQTDLQWFATGLAHSTIFACMRYIGFPKKWIDFLQKYLEAPLNLNTACEGRSPQVPRIRKRGAPMAHGIEKFTGELVLFFMDLAVNQTTGMLLYRLHDDIWFVGEPDRVARTWECLQVFAKVFGLEFNINKTGSAYVTTPDGHKRDPKIAARLPQGPVAIGFLVLDPATGEWAIDQTQVDAHVAQLRKQLAVCGSVLEWVQTWNSCIGRFFEYTFGEPAHCLGAAHVDSVLATHQKIQRDLFGDSDGGNMVDHVKSMLFERFGIVPQAIPDAFLFLQPALGGLGLRNPFVPLFLVKSRAGDELATPQARVDVFLADERERWLAAKKQFDQLSDEDRQRWLHHVYHDLPPKIEPDELDSFMSLAEFAQFRESTSEACGNLYRDLMQPTRGRGVEWAANVSLPRRVALEIQDEAEWFLQLHAKLLIEEYGGMELVDRQFLPTGVLAMMKSKKVTWQMVL